MVEFGKQLGDEQNPNWRYAYLNYESLKLQLELMEEARKRGQALDISLLMFQRHVDAEVASMGDFYVAKIASIQSNIIYLNGRRNRLADDLKENISKQQKLVEVEHELKLWRQVAKQVKDLTDFAALNIAAVRKIEKKLVKNFGDELVADLEKKSSIKVREQKIEQFLSDSSRSGFESIQHVAEIEEARNVIAEAMAQLHGLRIFLNIKQRLQKTQLVKKNNLVKQANFATSEIRNDLLSKFNTQNLHDLVDHDTDDNPPSKFPASFLSAPLPDSPQIGSSKVPDIVLETEIAPALSETRPLGSVLDAQIDEAWGRLMEDQRKNLLTKINPLQPKMHEIVNYESIILEMIQAQEKAQEESRKYKQQEHLVAYAQIFTPAPKDSEAVATLLGLCLNLGSTLLFMANYNIVIPLIAPLCKKLGFATSFGGLIIGCADVSAMIAAFVYSGWTNKRFKIPLLFTCIMLMIANIMFSLSYDFSGWTGMVVLLLARLLTGFGSARAINRRYIAEFVSGENRTKASAAFVAASGVGMALGPLLAAPLSKINPVTKHFFEHAFTIDQITVSGYLMLFVWLAYLLVTLFFFEEPRDVSIGIEDIFKAQQSNTPTVQQEEEEEEEEEEKDLQTPLLEYGQLQQNGIQSTDNDDTDIDADEKDDLISKADLKQIVVSQQNRDIKQVERSIWRSDAVMAVGVCILMLFMLKLLQQGTISSTAIFETPLTYNKWNTAEVGIYLACLNLGMLPVNFVVAAISPYVSDRMVMLVGLVLVLFGCTFVLSPPAILLTFGRYLGGTIPIVIATVALEGVSTSLLSKKVTPEMKKGTFNAGLLSTISGSTGRFLGNMGILVLGQVAAIISGANDASSSLSIYDAISQVTIFANLLFGVFDIVVVVSVIMYFLMFTKLSK